MDVATHALASVALARTALPRAPRMAWVAILAAGTVADLDGLSSLFGPAAYLGWHRTYLHSLLVSLLLSVALSALVWMLLRANASTNQISLALLFGATLLSALLHVALDACQSTGVELFWPFSAHRMAADWLAGIDPWIIALLLVAILVPELLRLISDEIGAKEKQPRGRNGAIAGFALVVVYLGARATLHSDALATMQARTYRSELPRRVAAFPESFSLFTWHGVVETESALRELVVDAGPGARFDPDSGVALFKPDPSPALDAARHSEAAKRFLAIARFPKATVEKTPDGSEVQIRDLRYALAAETPYEIVVLVKVDRNSRVVEDELVWARDLRHR
jgi:membrane-bound metal-dependent hydrolase YbcI (DUF457 family)